MCNDYRSRVELGTIGQEFNDLRIPLLFPEGRLNLEPRDDIRITDRAPVVRRARDPAADQNAAELVMRRWSWPGPGGKPVYNFRSEGRAFGEGPASGRCLIVADGFYEFTDPAPGPDGKRPRRKDKWLLTVPGAPFFCLAGIWRAHEEVGEAFTMLTVAAGPDVAPLHHRQPAVLLREDWPRWLDPSVPAAEILRPSPPGSLHVARAGG